MGKMQKMRKRLIGLIMAVIMVCVLLPLDAATVHAGGPLTQITNVGLSIKIPKAGSACEQPSVPAPAMCEITAGEGFSIQTAYWYNEWGISEPTFQEGHKYFVEVTLIVDSGYEFPSDVTATLNEGLEVWNISTQAYGGKRVVVSCKPIEIVASETTDITLQVNWDDRNNANNARPDSMSVILQNHIGDIEETEYTVKASDGWKLTVEDLPLEIGNYTCSYRAYAGAVYSHDIPGYTFYDGTPENDYTITCVYDEDYQLWVSGTQVNSNNKNDILNDGTVSFDPEKCILNLNNADIPEGDHSSGACILSYGMDLTITGEGNIKGADYGIYMYDSTAKSPVNLTFDNANVEVYGGFTGIITYGDMTVNGGVVLVGGTESAIEVTGNFKNVDGIVNANAEKTAISVSGKALFAEGEGVTGMQADYQVLYAEDGIEIGKTHNIFCEPDGAVAVENEILKSDYSGQATDAIIAPADKTANVYKNKQKGIWYRADNGMVTGPFTGIVKEGGKWIFVRNGKPDSTFEGIAQATNGTWLGNWYYCKNGVIDKTFTGIAQATNGTWYYCKKGKIDRTFTDKIAPCTNGNKYYVKNGKPTKNFDQKIAYCPADKTWYYCTKGRVDLKFSGKIAYCTNGDWYYVTKGLIDKSFTGIAEATNGKLYYVRNGKLDKTFSGTITYNGKTYVIKNGAVKKVS